MAKKRGLYSPRRRKTPSPSPSSARFYTDGDGFFKGWIVENTPRKTGPCAGHICKKYIDPEKKYKFSSRKAALEYLETGKIKSCLGPGRTFFETSPLPSAKRQKVNDSQMGSESSNSFEAANDESPSLLPFGNVSGASRTTSPTEDLVKEDERVNQQLGSEEKSDFTPLLPKRLLLRNDELASLQPPCQATVCSYSHSVSTQVIKQGESDKDVPARVNEEGSLKQVLKGLFSLPKAVYNWYYEKPNP